MEQEQIQLCTIEEIQSWDVILDTVQNSLVSMLSEFGYMELPALKRLLLSWYF